MFWEHPIFNNNKCFKSIKYSIFIQICDISKYITYFNDINDTEDWSNDAEN